MLPLGQRAIRVGDYELDKAIVATKDHLEADFSLSPTVKALLSQFHSLSSQKSTHLCVLKTILCEVFLTPDLM